MIDFGISLIIFINILVFFILSVCVGMVIGVKITIFSVKEELEEKIREKIHFSEEEIDELTRFGFRNIIVLILIFLLCMQIGAVIERQYGFFLV